MQPPPMKLWELFSAFRTEREVLVAILSADRWREPYFQYFSAHAQLVSEQRRDILDAPVPFGLSREVAARSQQHFFYYPARNAVRKLPISGERSVPMTALEIHDKFGGWMIEEILEYGSAPINAD